MNQIKNLTIILSIVSIIWMVGCKKTEIYEPGWIGIWEIYQVDSAYYVWWEDSIYIIEVFHDKGIIEFKDDSTGYFKLENSDRIYCLGPEFTWSHYYGSQDSLVATNSSNGYEYFVVGLEMNAEDMILRLPRCTPPAGVGMTGGMYKVYANRKK